jgi:prepilin-type processing-associated H-X9-DG protein
MPYIKSGQMTTYSDGSQYVNGDLWNSPSQPPNSMYGYGIHDGIIPYDYHWYNPTVFNNSHSTTQLQRPGDNLLVTTVGINPSWGAGSAGGVEAFMWTWCNWTWPVVWDSTGMAQYEGDNSDADGKIGWKLPRYRYNSVANVAWTDGHAKGVIKGAMNYCKNIFTEGFNDDGGNDDWLLDEGNACYGKT